MSSPSSPTPHSPAAHDAGPDAARPRERLVTRDVALIMVATFFFMAASMLGGPIIAGFAQSLGADGLLMGFIAGALSLSALFCRPVAGNLADRTNKRRLAIVGAALYLASNLWYACAPDTVSLLGARILNGVGFACISVCLSAWLAMLLPLSRMGAGMGLYGTMNALAQAVGPDLGIRASQSLGYRAAFLIAAGLSAMIVVAVLLVRDPGRPLPRADARVRGRGPRLGALFEPRVVPLAIVFMMFGIPYFANQAFLVDYAHARGLSVAVSAFFPVYAVALLALRLALRDWFDRRSFGFFMLVCTLGDVGMLLCLTALRGFWSLAAAALCTAVSYGLMSSATQAKAVLIAGKARSGMANTTYYAGIDLGMFLGPLIGGLLYERLPIGWFYPALLATMPVAWAVFALARRGMTPAHGARA